MKWKDLPVEIQERIKEIRKEQRIMGEIYGDESLGSLFSFDKTKEGWDFWYIIHNEDVNHFYTLYPRIDEYSLPDKWIIYPNDNIENTIVCTWLNETFNKQISMRAFFGRGKDWYTSDGKWFSLTTSQLPEAHQEITFEQFQKYVLNKTTQTIMKTNKLTRKQLIEAYNRFSCSKWQFTIMNILQEHAVLRDEDEITIPQDTIKLLLSEGSPEQQTYAMSLGIELKPDKNAFIGEFDRSEVRDLSKKIFGDNTAFQIIVASTPKDKPELEGRAFWVASKYKVEIGPGRDNDGTYISITKK